MRTFTLVLFWISILVLPLPAHAWPGTVIEVPDGDSLVVAPSGSEKKPVRVRLYGVDAPELGQSAGPEARQWLAERLPAGAQVEITPYAEDKYGRIVGVVQRDGKALNGELVAAGFAWVYWPYCKESFCRQWGKAEKRARSSRTGLWREQRPERPDRWRRRHPRR